MITKWVIPSKLSSEDVYHLPDQCIVLLADISTDIVVFYVNKFINENLNSHEVIDKLVAKKLERCYDTVNKLKDYLSSKEAYDAASELNNLSIEDISATVDITRLYEYKALIQQVFKDNSVVKPTKELTTSYLEEKLKELTDLAEKYEGEAKVAIYRLKGIIKAYKGIFRNAPFKRSNTNPFRGVIFKADHLSLLLYSLNFLIPKLESEQNPTSWRLL